MHVQQLDQLSQDITWGSLGTVVNLININTSLLMSDETCNVKSTNNKTNVIKKGNFITLAAWGTLRLNEFHAKPWLLFILNIFQYGILQNFT